MIHSVTHQRSEFRRIQEASYCSVQPQEPRYSGTLPISAGINNLRHAFGKAVDTSCEGRRPATSLPCGERSSHPSLALRVRKRRVREALWGGVLSRGLPGRDLIAASRGYRVGSLDPYGTKGNVGRLRPDRQVIWGHARPCCGPAGPGVTGWDVKGKEPRSAALMTWSGRASRRTRSRVTKEEGRGELRGVIEPSLGLMRAQGNSAVA